MKYCELRRTGRIVSETSVRLAYECCSGNISWNDPKGFEKFMKDCDVRYLPESEITVENLIKGSAFVEATILYKGEHGCTLMEAKDACNKIRNMMQK